LPDIGTAGVAALPIEQEVRYGNAFMRFARAGLPIIDDPCSTNTSTIWASGC
jgi:predicted Zn-dependent protease